MADLPKDNVVEIFDLLDMVEDVAEDCSSLIEEKNAVLHIKENQSFLSTITDYKGDKHSLETHFKHLLVDALNETADSASHIITICVDGMHNGLPVPAISVQNITTRHLAL